MDFRTDGGSAFKKYQTELKTAVDDDEGSQNIVAGSSPGQFTVTPGPHFTRHLYSKLEQNYVNFGVKIRNKK